MVILNLKTIKIPYKITVVVFFFMLVVEQIKLFQFRTGVDIGNQINVSVGTFLWLLIPLAAIFIASRNFPRMINLGGKRKHFFIGSFISYAILATIISLIGTLIYFLYDRFILDTGMYDGLISLIEICKWDSRGPMIAFLQQFAFLFMLGILFHTFTLLQSSWGWIVNMVLVILIAVFVLTTPIRIAFYNILSILLFYPNALVQIVACVALAVVLYAFSYPLLYHENI